MSKKYPVIAITGSSGSGTSTVRESFQHIFTRDGIDADIIEGTKICVENKKITKWIIETGALSKDEIRNISKRITKLIQSHFPTFVKNIYIKTSTGYYGGYGATLKDVKVIKSVSGNLKIKASGGISNLKDTLAMIEAGADRIGTSKARYICNEK